MDREDIKRQYKMRDILQMYGLHPNRSGFINCPFHNEDSPSLKIYPDSYYCFGCGKGGDILKFVMDYERIPFKEAYIKLGGTYIDRTGKTKIQVMQERKDSIIKTRKKLAGEDTEEKPMDKKERIIREDIKNFSNGMKNFPRNSEEWCFCQLRVAELEFELQEIEDKKKEGEGNN